MVTVSHTIIVGMMCEKSGNHLNMSYYALLMHLVRACRFASSAVTP
jgi:hypothetical protein